MSRDPLTLLCTFECVTTTVLLLLLLGPSSSKLTQKTRIPFWFRGHSFLTFRQQALLLSLPLGFFHSSSILPPVFFAFTKRAMFRGFTRASRVTGNRGYFMSYKTSKKHKAGLSDEDYNPFVDEQHENSEEYEGVHACVYIFLFPTNASSPTFSHPPLTKSTPH